MKRLLRKKRLIFCFILFCILYCAGIRVDIAKACEMAFKDAVFMDVGKRPTLLSAGSFNQDSKVDLAVLNDFDNNVSILEFENGLFKPIGDTLDLAIPANVLAMVTADINGDGRVDIAVVDQESSAIYIFFGSLDGSYSTENSGIYLLDVSPSAAIFADFNGDSMVDLVITNQETKTISLFLGTGDNVFFEKANDYYDEDLILFFFLTNNLC
ncbi:MAG: VCBS repeat-containing protein [bacterium]